MKGTFYSLWLLPLLFLIDGNENMRPGKDHALFFAVDDYKSTSNFNDLKNPIKDAEAIAKELNEMFGFETHIYKNPNRNKIYEVLKEWSKETFGPNDQLFIFFSGHGDFDEFTKKGYYIAQGNREREDRAYIDLTTLGNIVTQLKCEHILLAIDACYSGTIDQKIAFRDPNFRRPNQTQQTEKDRLIQNLLRNRSRLLITSGGKRRTRDGVDHSPFAKAILRGLKKTYTYGDGLFIYQDLLGELRRESPTPHEGELANHDQGGFVFVAKDAVIPTPPTDLSDMVFVQGGTFQMGDQFGDGYNNEKPVHSVTVSDYYISNHEVTNAELAAFLNEQGNQAIGGTEWYEIESSSAKIKGSNGRFEPESGYENHATMEISWYGAIAFCNWKSEQSGLQKVYTISGSTVSVDWSANGYRLPTEAEWEYASRSRGKKEKWAGTSNESSLKDYANYGENVGKTQPVKSYKPNDLGLYDMSGNVWEWCWDWYDSAYYASSNNASDPRGPSTGSYRVHRGGGWYSSPRFCRAAYRNYNDPSLRSSYIGFRLASSSR